MGSAGFCPSAVPQCRQGAADALAPSHKAPVAARSKLPEKSSGFSGFGCFNTYPVMRLSPEPLNPVLGSFIREP